MSTAVDVFTAAIDQGTTSSRFIIFDKAGSPVASHQIEFEQIYLHSGWIEHDPQVILESVNTCMHHALKEFQSLGHNIHEIRCLGITNQRETTIVWDAVTGKCLTNAIVWCDTRTAKLVHELKQKEGSDEIHSKCGLPLSTYPSSVKLMWMLRNIPEVAQAYDSGRLAFGTVDSWLLYNLTGVHATDPTNASRTMFMNIHTLEYDSTLIDWFDVGKVRLPKILPSSDEEGYGVVKSGPLEGIPITGCLGDQSSALVGQCAVSRGAAKNTYGTGCFLLFNTGEVPVISKNGLLTTVAYVFPGHKPVYALEGSIAVAGAAVKFLRDNLKIISSSNEIGVLAEKVKDTGGVVFVTAFSGLFAPYWIDDARGTIFGITNYTQREHICRAAIEATCFQTKAIIDAMEKDSGAPLQMLAVDGGMSNSDECMQMQADIIGIEVHRPLMRETTALGAALAAGMAKGVWLNFDEFENIKQTERTTFSPRIGNETRSRLYKTWNRAVEKCKGWVLDDEE